MANFAVCVDPDVERRRQFIDAAGPRLVMLPDLVTGQAFAGDAAIAWAAGSRAPVSSVSDRDSLALIFGEVITAEGARVTPEGLRDHWTRQRVDALRLEFDGYYAACVRLADGRLIIGSDRLGIFPIYYAELGDVLLIGSSPETFSCHPAFCNRFNPAGLIGLLLTNGLFDGETLWSGVRRLSGGHFLVREPHGLVNEVRGYQVAFTDRYLELSFDDHLELLDGALRKTIDRHAPKGRPYSTLLSGGLDSRTLVGYVNRAGGDVTALTLGQPSDFEVRCARAVAKSLRLTQYIREVDTSRFSEYARLHTRWDHCAAGSSLLMEWGVTEHLASVPAAGVMGLGLDWVLGGHAPTVPNLSFDQFFAYQNAWGMSPGAITSLVRHDVFDDLVAATMAKIEATYRGYSDVEWRRAWGFSLHHRNRFHIGSEAWRFSFGAWPILPAYDGLLLELGGGLPPTTAADRRAQYELLRTRFPKLAALPLDRNSHNVRPLSPSVPWRLGAKLTNPLRRARRAVRRRLGLSNEQRRYYRIFEINGAGWRRVRRLAEPYRELGYEFFDRRALNAFWPPPDHDVAYTDGITDVAAFKTVLGFLIWANDHLSR